MTIYLNQPSLDALVAYAFSKYLNAREIRLHSSDGTYRTYAAPKGREADGPGVVMNFTTAHLWSLMKADQAVYQATHKDAEVVA